MPFCISCGARVEPGVQSCTACQGKAAMSRGCPRCGAPVGGPQSRFCITCGAPLAATPAAPAPAALKYPAGQDQQRPGGRIAGPETASARAAPPPGAGSPAGTPPRAIPGGTPKAAALIDGARKERGAIYQRLGRQFLAACYEGKLPYDRLPDDLARQVQGGIAAMRKGHAALASAGICPRCLEPALSGSPQTCSRCRLVVPTPATPRA
jgi:hypothetical protein